MGQGQHASVVRLFTAKHLFFSLHPSYGVLQTLTLRSMVDYHCQVKMMSDWYSPAMRTVVRAENNCIAFKQHAYYNVVVRSVAAQCF